jgi:hypothetical protein
MRASSKKIGRNGHKSVYPVQGAINFEKSITGAIPLAGRWRTLLIGVVSLKKPQFCK